MMGMNAIDCRELHDWYWGLLEIIAAIGAIGASRPHAPVYVMKYLVSEA